MAAGAAPEELKSLEEYSQELQNLVVSLDSQLRHLEDRFYEDPDLIGGFYFGWETDANANKRTNPLHRRNHIQDKDRIFSTRTSARESDPIAVPSSPVSELNGGDDDSDEDFEAAGRRRDSHRKKRKRKKTEWAGGPPE